jgi:hypothetical protein
MMPSQEAAIMVSPRAVAGCTDACSQRHGLHFTLATTKTAASACPVVAQVDEKSVRIFGRAHPKVKKTLNSVSDE